MSATGRFAIARAHPNIALAKYWGKVPGGGNAPAVPSLSVTLAGMATETRVTLDSSLDDDTLELNGEPGSEEARRRVRGLLDRVRAESKLNHRASVVSRNDFPTAAGLASSASGFAALALAATHAFGLSVDLTRVSDLARRASASSARSLFGGFVELAAGLGDDALLAATPIAAPNLLDLRVLVAVTTEKSKEVGSTSGMNHTAETSPFYAAWVAHAPSLFRRVKDAVLANDLARLGEAAEESALAMHATAIAAAPAVLYWNGATVETIRTVRRLRAKGTAAWVTIDAGPHVKVLVAPSDVESVKSELASVEGVLRVLEARPGEGATIVDSGDAA